MIDSFLDGFFFGREKNRNVISKKWAGVNVFYRLLSMALNRFNYDLPDTMDARFLELCLLYAGQCLVVKKDGELRNLQPIASSSFGPYGYPNAVQGMDYMGKTYGRYIPDCPGNVMPDSVLIYDDKRNISPIYRIRWYADRLMQLQGSIGACITNLRGSVIVSCTVEQSRAVKRAFEDAGDGKPVILNFNSEEGAMQLRPDIMVNPITGDTLMQLMEVYDKTMCDFLTEFGINANGVANKLSGVSDMELQQNEMATELALKSALDARKQGMKKIKAMFGVDCEVNVNLPELREVGGMTSNVIDEEGEYVGK